MSLPNLRLQVLCTHFSACVLKFWLRKTDWKDRARLEIIIRVWELCFWGVSQPLSRTNGQLHWHFEQRGRGGGRQGLMGLFWQAICAALYRESWKWTTNWRIILVLSEPACSNLNYTTGWGRLETRSRNSIPCVPQRLSSFSPRSAYLFRKTFQGSNCHQALVFAAWNPTGQLWATLIFLPEAASATGLSSKAWEGNGRVLLAAAPVVPGSLGVTLASSWPFWVHRGSTQLDHVVS